MRGWHGAGFALALALGACAAPPPLSAPAKGAAPTPLVASARAARAVVLSSAGRLVGGYRHLHATASGRLVAQSALGLHRIDPTTGEELLLLPLPPGAMPVETTYAGSLALLRWDESSNDDGTFDRRHVAVLDLERGQQLLLPEPDPQQVALSGDGARLVWLTTAGDGGVLDTATGTIVEALPAPMGRGSEPLLFSASGRYLLWGDRLRDLETHREVWQRPASATPDRAWFTTTRGHEVLVSAGRTELVLVFADDATTRRADIDCVDPASSYAQGTLPGPDVFVRICPRGAIYVDLRRLADHVATAPMPPTRVKHARAYRVASDRLLLFVGPRNSGFTGEGTGWVAYDPRTGRADPVTTSVREIREVAGPYTIEEDDTGGCQLRGLPTAGLLPREGSGCAAALAKNGAWYATAGNGTLTIASLPSLDTLYAAGDSLYRRDDSFDMRVEVEPTELVVHGAAYGAEPSENTFRVRRTLPSAAIDFVAAADDLAGARDGGAPLTAIPLGWLASCRQKGLVDRGQTRLVACSRGSNERSYRLDRETLALRAVHEGQRDDIVSAYGNQGDRDFLPEARAGFLPAVQIREHTSREILGHLHLGWDFAIAADGSGRVQVFGNRKRAATWLRCLDPDGHQLRPFAACAATVETALY